MSNKWLIYGATGYTGRLIVAEAQRRGLDPIVAGRSEQALEEFKEGAEVRCFDLGSRQSIAKQLEDVDWVLNCAGPFSQTARPLMAACLHAGAHYLDITGEVEVFEHAQLLNKSARAAGIMLCPGVGFDVVPTDCLAKALSEKMPDADSLWLGFSSRSGMSPGTAKTMVEALPSGGRIRQAGLITRVPLAYKVRQIDFGSGSLSATTIPWGDVATAYYSTGIPNVEVYVPLSPAKIKQMRRLEKVRHLLAWKWLQKLLKRRIDKTIKGPDEKQLHELRTQVWGEVINSSGDVLSGRIETPNGYQLTVLSSLAVVEHLLQTPPPVGYQTPSTLMGSDFIEKLPGCGKFSWQDTRSESADALE